jgi:hypothetical protein
MARVEVTGISALTRSLNTAVDKIVKSVENTVYKTARANTPVLTGNAKKNWRRKEEPKGFTVENRVPYIERLDKGYSKKKPKGMTGPTLTEINRRNK